MEGDPKEIVARLAASGSRHVYVDGGQTVQQFLRAGLIQRLTITRVPVLIGQGIPLFGALPRDVRLRHLGTRSYESGLVTQRVRGPRGVVTSVAAGEGPRPVDGRRRDSLGSRWPRRSRRPVRRTEMRAYLLITGVLFTLMAALHLYITYEHGFRPDGTLAAAAAPGAVLVISAVLAVWAFRLLKRVSPRA